MEFFLPALQALNSANIKYVLVGGLAVVLHGHNRLTGDVDIVLELSFENCSAAMQALSEHGFVPRVPVKAIDFANQTLRESWINQKGMVVFSMFLKSNPIFGINIFAKYPIPFENLYSNSDLKRLGGLSVQVASIDDIIAMKLLANRPKDLEDIAALKALQNEKKQP